MLGEVIARVMRALGRPEEWSIGELPEGAIGRVIGAARPLGRPLTAPFSGRECVGYVASLVHRGYELVREARVAPFVLEDASGLVIVDPSRAALDLDREGDPDAPVLRYREAIIGAGDTICVVGMGTRLPDAGGPYRAAWPASLQLRAPPGRRIRIGLARGSARRARIAWGLAS